MSRHSESNSSSEAVDDALRPTVADINLDALVNNYKAIATRAAPASVMPILKANAYGHGLVACARALEPLGIYGFGVAFLSEGVELRRAGIKLPIVAVGGISGRSLEKFLQYNIGITASSVMKLEAIDEVAGKVGKRAQIHLKIDTGMERIGQHYYTAEAILEKTLSCKNCDVVSVFSHLARGEDEDRSFSKLQVERFLECLRFFEDRSLPMPLRHMANSGGILQCPEAHLDLVRPGALLYGILPAPHMAGLMKLSPVLSLRSEVVFFKVVKKGAGVSYDHTWTASEDTRVVTIPLGYGDGYSRGLSNRGSVLIRGRRCPIVGKVCMDQFMADLGPDGTAYNEDEVVLIGSQGEERITVEEIAALVGTDPRDVLCSLNGRIPRRYRQSSDPLV